MSRRLTARPVALARTAKGRTLPQMLRDNARDMADTVAIRSKRAGLWRAITWAALDTRVRRTAAGLAALGLGPGQTLCLISENREEAWITEMAAISLGAVAVSVYPDASAGELAYVLDHSRAVMVLTEDQEQVDKLLAAPAAAPGVRKILFVEPQGLWHYADPRLVDLARVPSDDGLDEIAARIEAGRQSDIAVYCYTSGTTGKPKAAMLDHAFILDNAYRLMGALGIEPCGRYLSYISPAWAAEQFFGFGLPLLAPLVVHFAEKPETVQADLREIGPDFLMFTPRQWEMQASDVEARMMDAAPWRQRLYHWGLARGHDRAAGRGGIWQRAVTWPLADQLVLKGVRDLLGLTRAKAVLSGGSGLSAELFARYRAFGVPLGNLYGSSELGLVATHRKGDMDPETMGELMPSDPTLAPPIEAWVDETGQLRLKGLAFSGYLDNPQASAEMGDGTQGYETGDAVRLDDSGALIFLDRAKDLRRLSTGAVYPPQFLENHLRAHAMVRDAIVIGDAARDRVVALVNIDMEIAGRFAERHGLAFGTFSELSQLPPVRAEIARAVAAVNARVDPGARIAGFANLPKELDADEEELTRSRKLRRGAIEAKYAALIDGLYCGADSVPLDIDVTYQDGRKSRLSARVAMNRTGEAAA
ncbi:AMP-dependent synthetase/ligase [Seohaeicola zhoushanensis]|uniref:AMP-dependent synthetase n=1 Tax=Seohaeicola zhoushanensis TaxID=1569283 RepID=A0A8J3GZA9_9RHOB|nr:AMP-binding protein [Seohaeicola zhoushanensis]GHF60412.1 AMP-dependent synthetase [Seohaeicola zhoushanensis]